MDISRPFPTYNIVDIKQLAQGHPVYLVSYDNDAFVIKAEDSRNNAQLRDPIEIMNVVDQNAKTRVVNKTELMALRNWIQAHGVEELNPNDLIGRIGEALRPPTPMGGPMQGQVIIMMEAKQGLMDLEAVSAGPKVDIKAMAQTLRQPGTLQKLGEIFAADCFSGNQDRINFESATGAQNQVGKQWGQTTLKCIQNPGNIFVSQENGASTVVGLDVFDGTNMHNTNDTFANENDGFWYTGRLLRQDAVAQRRDLCVAVVADIETILGARNRKIIGAKKTRMKSNAPAEIQRGMEVGADKILIHLKQKYSGGGMSVGLQRKLNTIGWLNRSNFPRL